MIVFPTIREPVVGFTDSPLTIVGLGVGVGLGLVRVFKGDDNSSIDGVPSDVVINYILVIACYVACCKTEQKVYNICAGENCRMNNSRITLLMIDFLLQYIKKYFQQTFRKSWWTQFESIR